MDGLIGRLKDSQGDSVVMVWRGRRAKTADPILAGLGLTAKDASPAARAALAALVDERDSLRAQLTDALALADRDPGLPTLNRRAFLREVARAASAVERYKGEAAVLFIDLNGFKRINDTHGHAAGDAVLRHVTRLIATHIRDSDRFGRMGGDEFAVLLSQVPAEEAHRKAAHLAHVIATTACVFEGVSHTVSASIGAHPFRWDDPKPTQDPEWLLAKADEAMYAAKHAARRTLAANG
jgi:diguanylate cyclase (GGDEF)-like protein